MRTFYLFSPLDLRGKRFIQSSVASSLYCAGGLFGCWPAFIRVCLCVCECVIVKADLDTERHALSQLMNQQSVKERPRHVRMIYLYVSESWWTQSRLR